MRPIHWWLEMMHFAVEEIESARAIQLTVVGINMLSGRDGRTNP
jgi:hypothetical protein